MRANTAELPSALERIEEIEQRVKDRRLAVFLDYDGTLTPIVDRPDQALLSAEMRDTVKELARHATVAVISGRDLRDVRGLVGIDGIFYAGSHGFEIEGPENWRVEAPEGVDCLPELDSAEEELRQRLKGVSGALVERKRFSIAVHYRMVDDSSLGAVEKAVAEVGARHPELRRATGKKVHELQPGVDWHKGKAVLWLLKSLDLNSPEVLPLYIGDDVTDEDAFETLRGSGIGIVVRDERRPTAAHYALDTAEEVRHFLAALPSPGGPRVRDI